MQTNANAQRDLDTLTALNRDYTASVQKGDVRRFEEILADDFMCSNPDGSLAMLPTTSLVMRMKVPVPSPLLR